MTKNFTESVIDVARERVNNQDQDCMVVMFGPKGLGKSTVALQAQLEFNPNFTLDHVGWTFEEHRQKILIDLPPGSGYHADEIRFHSMDFRTNIGIEMDKLLTEIRPFNQFTTWTSARMFKVMGSFLEFAHFLCYFYGLGKCVVLKRNDRIMKGNVFGIETKNLEKVVTPRDFSKYFIRPAKRGKMYVGKYFFDQYSNRLTKEFYERYKALRIEATRKRFTEVKDFILSKEQCIELVERGVEVGITYSQMGAQLSRSPRTIARYACHNKQS